LNRFQASLSSAAKSGKAFTNCLSSHIRCFSSASRHVLTSHSAILPIGSGASPPTPSPKYLHRNSLTGNHPALTSVFFPDTFTPQYPRLHPRRSTSTHGSEPDVPASPKISGNRYTLSFLMPNHFGAVGTSISKLPARAHTLLIAFSTVRAASRRSGSSSQGSGVRNVSAASSTSHGSRESTRKSR